MRPRDTLLCIWVVCPGNSHPDHETRVRHFQIECPFGLKVGLHMLGPLLTVKNRLARNGFPRLLCQVALSALVRASRNLVFPTLRHVDTPANCRGASTPQMSRTGSAEHMPATLRARHPPKLRPLQ
eukprot:3146225-Pyramimonas_sp.AAC.1